MPNTQNFSDPVGVGRSVAQAIGLEAIDHRRGQGALSAPQHGNSFGTLSGVFPGGTSGAGKSNDLQGFISSGLTVTHNAGHYACDRGGGSLYLGMAFASNSITLDPGDPTFPRIDLVVIRNRDPDIDSNVTESARLVFLKGTPAAVPSRPDNLLTSGDVPLTYFTVGAGGSANTITAVDDARLFVTSRGGVTPRTSWDTRPGAYEGDMAYNLATQSLQVWSGTAWIDLAGASAWSTYAPPLFSGGGAGVSPGTTQVGMGTNWIRRGRFKQLGKRLDLQLYFQWGTAPWNAGAGFITSRLPSGMKTIDSGMPMLGTASLYAPYFSSMYTGLAFVRPDDNVVWIQFPNDNTDNRLNYYRVALTAGTSGQSVPNVGSGGFAEGGNLQVALTLEVA